MAVKLIKINKSFGKQNIINDFSYVFEDNSCTCIMGESGVGKTTLINIILGILKPDSGIIDGIAGKRVTAVFQEDRLCEQISAIDNIRIVCNKEVSIDSIRNEFEKVGLREYDGKKTKDLSGGMKRRVAIVRALINNPDIVILDEAFKGLDSELKNKIYKYVKAKTNNKILINITHDLDEINVFGAKLLKL